jgi:hypothetical protein
MRRVFFTVVASSALALAVTGVAAAQHGKRHHSQRASSHKRHHRHAHIVRFGTLATTSAPSSSTSSRATPSSPAGTVASFTGGVLTITLADKSTVSGKVTDQTELECQSPAPTASASSHDGGDDGDRHDSSTSTSSQQAGSQSGDDEQGEDQGEDQGDDDQGERQSCTTAALETGAVVQEAELSISSAGAVWHKVELG